MKYFILLFTLFMSTASTAATETLKPCPDKPNCVSSTAVDGHSIDAFILLDRSIKDLKKISALISQLDTHVSVIHDQQRIHAEITSRVFGFVDDLDLLLIPDQHIIHVRSASRTGYYDFGVNRRRVEKLRSLLKNEGFIQ
ncbi:MAG: hypothetical protein ACJAZI_000076 [Cycloclasticus sp.]|jgi:uncharacterized protein (DUF1499 family)